MSFTDQATAVIKTALEKFNGSRSLGWTADEIDGLSRHAASTMIETQFNERFVVQLESYLSEVIRQRKLAIGG